MSPERKLQAIIGITCILIIVCIGIQIHHSETRCSSVYGSGCHGGIYRVCGWYPSLKIAGPKGYSACAWGQKTSRAAFMTLGTASCFLIIVFVYLKKKKLELCMKVLGGGIVLPFALLTSILMIKDIGIAKDGYAASKLRDFGYSSDTYLLNLALVVVISGLIVYITLTIGQASNAKIATTPSTGKSVEFEALEEAE